MHISQVSQIGENVSLYMIFSFKQICEYLMTLVFSFNLSAVFNLIFMLSFVLWVSLNDWKKSVLFTFHFCTDPRGNVTGTAQDHRGDGATLWWASGRETKGQICLCVWFFRMILSIGIFLNVEVFHGSKTLKKKLSSYILCTV